MRTTMTMMMASSFRISSRSFSLRSVLLGLGLVLVLNTDKNHHPNGLASAQELRDDLPDILEPIIDVGQPVFTSQCYEEILQADLDNNMQLNQEEFVGFAQLKGPPGLIDHVTSFTELPASYQLAFTALACLCSDPDYGGDAADTDCCVGSEPYIRITEPPGDQQADADFLLLYATCALTDAAARETLNSQQPTLAPVPAPPPPTPPPTPSPTTMQPSSTPSLEPTTMAPTAEPSSVPTASPTAEPSSVPTSSPTMVPTTAAPSTAEPTLMPNITPRPSISFSPSPAPSTLAPTPPPVPGQAPPTPSPTPPTPVNIATVQYEVALTDGKQPNVDLAGYYSDLTVAMDLLSQEVAAEFFGGTTVSQQLNVGGGNGRQLRRYQIYNGRRSLQEEAVVQVQLPTAIAEAADIECENADLAGNDDLCQEITSQIRLLIWNADDVNEVVNRFQARLFNAIFDGRLQKHLNDLNSGAVVLTGANTTPPGVDPSTGDDVARDGTEPAADGGLSAGATTGIVMAAVAIVVVPLVVIFMKRGHRRYDGSKSDIYHYEPYDGADGGTRGANGELPSDLEGPESIDTSLYTDVAVADQTAVGAATAAAIAAKTASADSNKTGSPMKENNRPIPSSPMGSPRPDGTRPLVAASSPPVYGRPSTSSSPDSGKRDIGRGDLAASQPPVYSKSIGVSNIPDFGSKSASRKALEAMEAGEDIVAEPEMDVERDSSSNAGSSGWSSSAGISSYNTGSVDDSMDAAAAAGTTLAAIGVTSALTKRFESDRYAEDDQQFPSASQDVSREQLDSLIEAGDWAAVGATAALLAAASDSQSGTSRASSRSRHSSENNSVDAARAAELDHLVDAGDWEGVVLAAAKFEAAEAAGGRDGGSSRGSRTVSSVDESSASGDSATGGATGSSPSASESLTGSDDPSKAKKRAELREEVEALVRRVVPEEIDNVDEMMNQFKGREEELVETLRTMQERAVAQKARTAGHKAAKVEARRSVQRGVVPGAPPPSSTEVVGGMVATSALAESSDRSSASGADTTGEASVANVRSALEVAIETGDWAAVGDAAAMMSDASTVSSAEVNRLTHTNLSVSTEGTPRSRQSLDGVNAARAAELDAMIDNGDWSGVIAAANRYTNTDKATNAPSAAGRTKEEEEALAQAEVWMKIAEQKKAEGATDAGASDAAEWAIHRSLSQLKQADKKQGNNTSGDEDEV